MPRAANQAEGVARELASRHQIHAAAFACDITDDAAVAKVVDDVVKRFGRLDILVNDAAYNKSIPFPDLDNLTMEVWDKIIAGQPDRADAPDQGGGAGHEGAGQGRIVNIFVGGGGSADRLLDRLCGVEGGDHPPDALHGGGLGA